MAFIYVHLSDIHFGQEKGGDIYIHDDVKEQLLADVYEYVSALPNGKADGIIISGDIAYSGQKKEYDLAGQWLDRLTAAVGCEVTDVQVVPGNHDVDREKITPICQIIIDNIIANGDDALDNFIAKVSDREFFYGRFHAYRSFAEAYDSPLDAEGHVVRQRTLEIAPNRRMMFHGVNTALICSASPKEEGGLLLGKRQRVLPNQPGLELIVIAHHPLRWLQDSLDAGKYLRSRARVFISGHEHTPSHKAEPLENGGDLLMISSGAVVPPQVNDKFTYCYNILEFDWDKDSDALAVTIHGRIWDDDRKTFSADEIHFNNGRATYTLQCPSFKKLPLPSDKENAPVKSDLPVVENQNENAPQVRLNEEPMVQDKEYQLVLLKFFRDLSSAQRLTLLIKFGAIPEKWSDPLTHSLERNALDKLVESGQLSKIHDAINTILYSNK